MLSTAALMAGSACSGEHHRQRDLPSGRQRGRRRRWRHARARAAAVRRRSGGAARDRRAAGDQRADGGQRADDEGRDRRGARLDRDLNPTDVDVPLHGYARHRRLRGARQGRDRRRRRRAGARLPGAVAGRQPGGGPDARRGVSEQGGRRRRRWRGPTDRSSTGSATARRRPTCRRRASPTARRPGRSSGTSRPARRTARERPAGGPRRAEPTRRRCPRPAIRASGSSATTRCRSSRSTIAPRRIAALLTAPADLRAGDADLRRARLRAGRRAASRA